MKEFVTWLLGIGAAASAIYAIYRVVKIIVGLATHDHNQQKDLVTQSFLLLQIFKLWIPLFLGKVLVKLFGLVDSVHVQLLDSMKWPWLIHISELSEFISVWAVSAPIWIELSFSWGIDMLVRCIGSE